MRLGGVFDTTIFLHILDEPHDKLGSRVESSPPHTPPSQGEWHLPDPHQSPNPTPLGGSPCYHDEYYFPERTTEKFVENPTSAPHIYEITKVKVLVKQFIRCRQVGEYTKEWIESVADLGSPITGSHVGSPGTDYGQAIQPIDPGNSSGTTPDDVTQPIKPPSHTEKWGTRGITVYYTGSDGKKHGQYVTVTKDQSGVTYSYPPNTPQEAKDAVESKVTTEGYR